MPDTTARAVSRVEQGLVSDRVVRLGIRRLSKELALNFQDDLRLLRRWRWDGTRCQKTAQAWLRNMDDARDALWPLMMRTHGVDADRASKESVHA